MDLQPVDYVSGLGQLPDPLKRYQEQLAFKVGLDAQKQDMLFKQAQVAAAEQKQQRAQDFQTDLKTALSDPNPSNISGLIMKYPEFADEIKGGWDVKEKATQQSDLTQLGEIYSAAAAGKWDMAASAARARLEADKAAGQADPTDQHLVDMLESGDPAQQKAALGLIGTHLAAVTGAEHFGTVYGALKGGYTLDAGATRFDDAGNIIAQSPFIKGADGTIYERDGTNGGTPSAGTAGTPDMTPDVASVASTLSASLPSPVVAGFLGNFHIEGGYTGAQGDGGSASGIAQWHADRAANFEKVIGKPVTEATPEEQAKFVLHEMEHPEEAGMTVAQRDEILRAKSPSQAAALIDKYYERSDGKARSGRMSAANAFAGIQSSSSAPSPSGAPPGYHVLTPGKPEPAKDSFRILTPDEASNQGLDPNLKYQINDKTGQITLLGGQSRQTKQIPQAVVNKAQPSIDVRDTMARLAGTWDPDFGGHAILGDNLNTAQRLLGSWSGAPEGMANWWADYQSMDNLVRNQLFGSALTEHEKQAYAATTISPRMDPKEIVKRFNRRRQIINGAVARQQNFLKKNGYDPDAVDALFQPLGVAGESAAPITVRSVQEAQKLAPGTLYVAPDGKVRRR